jgi:hypothetical protein
VAAIPMRCGLTTSITRRHRNRTTTSKSPKRVPCPPKADQSGFEP